MSSESGFICRIDVCDEFTFHVQGVATTKATRILGTEKAIEIQKHAFHRK